MNEPRQATLATPVQTSPGEERPAPAVPTDLRDYPYRPECARTNWLRWPGALAALFAVAFAVASARNLAGLSGGDRPIIAALAFGVIAALLAAVALAVLVERPRMLRRLSWVADKLPGEPMQLLTQSVARDVRGRLFNRDGREIGRVRFGPLQFWELPDKLPRQAEVEARLCQIGERPVAVMSWHGQLFAGRIWQATPASARDPRLGLIAPLVVLVIAAGLVQLAASAWQDYATSGELTRRGQASASWPTGAGRILAARLDTHTSSAGRGSGTATSYRARIDYDYLDASQTQRNGSTIQFGNGWTDFRSDAEKWLTRFPAGREVEVRYDPANPTDSVLVSGVPPELEYQRRVNGFTAIALSIVDGIFLLIGTVVLLSRLRRCRTPSSATAPSAR